MEGTHVNPEAAAQTPPVSELADVTLCVSTIQLGHRALMCALQTIADTDDLRALLLCHTLAPP